MAKGNKKKAKKRTQKAVGNAAPTTTTTTTTGGVTGTTTTLPKPLNDSNKMTPKSGPGVPPSPSKPIRLPSPEQAASLEKLQSFPTPTKSNGKDVEKTPEYVWKAPYEPGSAWADQVDSDMFKRGGEKKKSAASPSPGGKRLSMTPQSVAIESSSLSPKNMTEASPGKTERVIAEATSPARIPDAKKAPTPPAGRDETTVAVEQTVAAAICSAAATTTISVTTESSDAAEKGANREKVVHRENVHAGQGEVG
jgi:hypothetical protein